MDQKKYTWHKVAGSENEIVRKGSPIEVIEVMGKKICLVRFQNKWFGFANTCPHSGGILAEGYIDSRGNIVCPQHNYKFNIQSGRNSSGEGYYLNTYPVEETPEGVFIGIEDSSPRWD